MNNTQAHTGLYLHSFLIHSGTESRETITIVVVVIVVFPFCLLCRDVVDWRMVFRALQIRDHLTKKFSFCSSDAFEAS